MSRWEQYGHRAMAIGWTIVTVGSLVVIVLRLT